MVFEEYTHNLIQTVSVVSIKLTKQRKKSLFYVERNMFH